MEEQLSVLRNRLRKIEFHQRRLEELRFQAEQKIREIIGPCQEVLEVGSHDKKTAGLIQQHLGH
jgi:hypothetical protein